MHTRLHALATDMDLGCIHIESWWDGAVPAWAIVYVALPWLFFGLILTAASWVLALIYYDVRLLTPWGYTLACYYILQWMATTLRVTSPVANLNSCSGAWVVLADHFYEVPAAATVAILVSFVAYADFYIRAHVLLRDRPDTTAWHALVLSSVPIVLLAAYGITGVLSPYGVLLNALLVAALSALYLAAVAPWMTRGDANVVFTVKRNEGTPASVSSFFRRLWSGQRKE